ncbi:chemotaxis-specific protein-glutamate methyltransferase CheB [Rhizosaccharibacter radicis]|uniref:Protein-glutamate methylesterase/protein-glutamine glutaminase n=1 Tax=Rhizosaccharibacter radicis TaxID=2782605 RepID=A0ABT1VYF5_9PROT|nr:chemotaxis-specific protein-glutamate methyltransferase CheB [Acetobacteraceae bacterium KSS12]
MTLEDVPPRRPGLQASIRVIICDDSAVIRGLLSKTLSFEPDIELVASVSDGAQAVEALRRQGADVVLLDLDMPVMDGLTALPLLLSTDVRVKVIIASANGHAGLGTARAALQAGAAAFVPKPASGSRDAFMREILAKLRSVVDRRSPPSACSTANPVVPPPPHAPPPTVLRRAGGAQPLLLAIGSSTGGPQALFTLFGALTRKLPVPIVLTQHMPASFTNSLAQHLSRLGHRDCAEAKEGQQLLPDMIYVAPGDRHLLIRRDGEKRLVAHLDDGPAEQSCRPAVDPMLRSASESCNGRVLAVILTGMGRDGCGGAAALVAAGGTVLAQDEVSSVVWGMPGAVARAGLCHAILPLDRLASAINDMLPVVGAAA